MLAGGRAHDEVGRGDRVGTIGGLVALARQDVEDELRRAPEARQADGEHELGALVVDAERRQERVLGSLAPGIDARHEEARARLEVRPERRAGVVRERVALAPEPGLERRRVTAAQDDDLVLARDEPRVHGHERANGRPTAAASDRARGARPQRCWGAGILFPALGESWRGERLDPSEEIARRDPDVGGAHPGGDGQHERLVRSAAPGLNGEHGRVSLAHDDHPGHLARELRAGRADGSPRRSRVRWHPSSPSLTSTAERL